MPLNSVTPIDGRYEKHTKELAQFFSEGALISYRILMEGEYLIALSGAKIGLKKLSLKDIKSIRALYKLPFEELERVKEIERITNHDVKAVEYFIKEKLGHTGLKNNLEWVHFGLTSEDTNNIAYALILRDALEISIIPKIEEIISELDKLAQKYKNLPMLARTHGQSASPTTFGKEMAVFTNRLEKRLSLLKNIKIEAKLNGATGNYNAHVAAYPKVNWVKFSQDFINSFNAGHTQKLDTNLLTTQIEPHDSYVMIFDALKHINTILLDLDQDMWRYISDGWLGQKPKEGEVGSSTMPHKINPIDFENSEGNLGTANAMFEFFARKLPISRLQRDLTDSTVERSFGSAFAYSYLGYVSLLRGLSKITVNENKMKEDLLAHPEVIAEAIQTVLRRENYPIPYEMLKDLTRGKTVILKDFHNFIDKLDLRPQIKKELKSFTPDNYTGLASKLVR